MNTVRFSIQSLADIAAFAQTQRIKRSEPIWATFVVDKSGALWLADRRSEHVGCSRGEDVQAAGELAFQMGNHALEVVEATNQSTGFCPPVESWPALEQAFSHAKIVHPGGWTRAFEFRRCPACGATNIIKEEWFSCAECDAELPLRWNFETN